MTKNDRVLKGFLGRLMKSQSGNVLAMVAAGVLPLLGLLGGGIDMSRIFLTKNRLQFACDSGALAGRKMMGGGAWNANSNKANTTAENIFNANFISGSYGSTGLTKAFSENAGNVTGTASATVPMAIMKVFGFTNKTISVTCSAEMRIPNTDVMFVLDNTGSMDDCPNGNTCNGNSSSKIAGLKTAVLCFYEALAKLDTSANCGSTPSGGNSSAVQLRFGFVPYSSNVNVGALLNNDWMADNWTYQSRVYQWLGTYTTTTSAWVQTSPASSSNTTSSNNQASCPNNTKTTVNGTPSVVSSTAPDGAVTSTTTNTRTTNGVWVNSCTQRSNGNYNYTINTYNNYVEQQTITQTPDYAYIYKPVTFDVSGLKAGGNSWNSSINLPVGTNGANTSVAWNGCIEERQAWQNMDGNPSDDYDPVPASAYDLDIDMVPSPADPATQWGPQLPNAVWGRYNGSGDTTAWVTTTSSTMSRNYNAPACPLAARKLQTYPTATAFQNYVNSMDPGGSTYHDIGMVWGARLMSPTGLFASENAFTPSGGQIERHLIFMTDGETNTSVKNMVSHGVDWWDRRQTNPAVVPTSGTNGNGTLTKTVDAKLQALCKMVKNKNITLWVIAFGTDVTAATKTNLQNCATSGRYYEAADSATLIANFKSIADQISQLRLTN
jgi:Flp pilus assembly protein TadG